MKIQYATPTDLIQIARCHIMAFPNSITSKLGVNSVRAMLGWYLSDDNKFLFYIRNENTNEIQGYCGGYIMDGRDIGSATGMIQQSFNETLFALLRKPWLFFHPEVLKKYKFITRNILTRAGLYKHTLNRSLQNIESNIPLTAGLVVIGVNPEFQGKGIGSLLQQEFEVKAKLMGAKRLQLSVRKNNSQAVKSYQRNGYTIQKEEGPSYVMVKELV